MDLRIIYEHTKKIHNSDEQIHVKKIGSYNDNKKIIFQVDVTNVKFNEGKILIEICDEKMRQEFESLNNFAKNLSDKYEYENFYEKESNTISIKPLMTSIADTKTQIYLNNYEYGIDPEEHQWIQGDEQLLLLSNIKDVESLSKLKYWSVHDTFEHPFKRSNYNVKFCILIDKIILNSQTKKANLVTKCLAIEFSQKKLQYDKKREKSINIFKEFEKC